MKLQSPFKQEEKSWEEVSIEKVPKNLQYEIVQEKDVLNADVSDPLAKTAVIKKGKVSKRKLFVDWKSKRYFVNHILKEKVKGKPRFLVRWNVNYSEAMNAKGEIVYSTELENLDMGDMVQQLKKAVGLFQGLQLDRNTLTLIGIALVFGIPIGLGLWPGILHPPNTVIHWVPRT